MKTVSDSSQARVIFYLVRRSAVGVRMYRNVLPWHKAFHACYWKQAAGLPRTVNLFLDSLIDKFDSKSFK